MRERGRERRRRERRAHVAHYDGGEEAYSAFLDRFVGLTLASLGDDGRWEDSGGEQDELGGGWGDDGGGFGGGGFDGY